MRSSSRSERRVRYALVAIGLLAGLTVPALALDDAAVSVTRSALGLGVENREIQGETDRFVEGQRAYFLTRVEGAEDGDRIRHIWIHDGKEVAVGLAVGGSPWRTWSSKMLYKGSAGDWAVEARTAEGRVLVRKEFYCDPAPE